jgi:hypothetical protein
MKRLIESLLLVRLGQELGTDCPLSRAIAELIETALKTGLF